MQFGAKISLLRNERLPKGPRFASESLDADTASGPVFQTDPLPEDVRHWSDKQSDNDAAGV